MGLNTLKSVSVSLLLLITIGCESDAVLGPQQENESVHVYVDMPLIDRIELNDYPWQTLYTIDGDLESDDPTVSLEYFRVTWDSDMFWFINDT